MNSKNSYRILAFDRSVSNDTRMTNLNNNDVIIGGSGSGKTGGYVIPNIRQHYGSMIITDTKGNLYRKYGQELTEAGYAVRLLDFVNPHNSTFSYNPLDYISQNPITKKHSEMAIVTLAKTLEPGVYEKDPFWSEAAHMVLTFLIAFTLEALPKREQNMNTVSVLFRIISDRNNTKIFDEWEICYPESFATKKYQMFRGISDSEKTWSSIMQFVANTLNLFESEETAGLYRSDLNRYSSDTIRDLGKKKMALFLNVSDTDRSMDRLINVFYTQALHELCHMADQSSDSRLKIPVRFILDDFAANVYIPDFDKIISVIRSREISVSLLLQSLTQLETLYTVPQASTIINNCDHMIYLGSQDLKTAEYVGFRAGKTMETVLSMPLDKAYLIERGKKAELVDKIKPYSEVYDESTLKVLERGTKKEGIANDKQKESGSSDLLCAHVGDHGNTGAHPAA